MTWRIRRMQGRWKKIVNLARNTQIICKYTLHSNIQMYILHTVLFMFLEKLTGRICFAIKSFFSLLISCILETTMCDPEWYFQDKLAVGHFHRVKCNKMEHFLLSRVVIARDYREEWKGLALYILASVCIFSILFFIHFLWLWQGEFD